MLRTTGKNIWHACKINSYMAPVTYRDYKIDYKFRSAFAGAISSKRTNNNTVEACK